MCHYMYTWNYRLFQYLRYTQGSFSIREFEVEFHATTLQIYYKQEKWGLGFFAVAFTCKIS